MLCICRSTALLIIYCFTKDDRSNFNQALTHMQIKYDSGLKMNIYVFIVLTLVIEILFNPVL